MEVSPVAVERTSARCGGSGHHPERARTRCLILSGALVLLSGCAAILTHTAATVTYFYEDEFPPAKVGGELDYKTRVVSEEKAPIPPVKFGQWFIPSSWAVALSQRWTDLPYVFDADGPEYCTALGVDKDRMLHASPAVRFLDPGHAKWHCPALIWKDDLFMVMLGSAHSHPTLTQQGERISAPDTKLGPILVEAGSKKRIEMLPVAVQLSSGEHLMGVDPETGREAPVPAQWLLFTRYNFASHVFLWTALPPETKTSDKSNFVRVYKPAPNDGWVEVGICWVDAADVRNAIPDPEFSPATHCNPDDFWLK